MKPDINYKNLTPDDFEQVIRLGNLVHGDGYLSVENLTRWHQQGIVNNINASYVAYIDEQLVGFRITFSAQQWQEDEWCSTELWPVTIKNTCYFKCNTVIEKHRGLGIGGKLLKLSISAAKQQGALAGVSHLWQQSPKNSAVAYFTRCGGKLIKVHPDKWLADSKQGYCCTLCGYECHCSAAEMMITF